VEIFFIPLFHISVTKPISLSCSANFASGGAPWGDFCPQLQMQDVRAIYQVLHLSKSHFMRSHCKINKITLESSSVTIMI